MDNRIVTDQGRINFEMQSDTQYRWHNTNINRPDDHANGWSQVKHDGHAVTRQSGSVRLLSRSTKAKKAPKQAAKPVQAEESADV